MADACPKSSNNTTIFSVVSCNFFKSPNVPFDSDNEREPIGKREAMACYPITKYKLKNKQDKNKKIWNAVPIEATTKPPKNRKNLIGTTRYSMTIVAHLWKHKWIARCVCGVFEVRNQKPWQKGLKKQTVDECQTCKYRQHLQRQAFFIEHKKQPPHDWPKRIYD